MMEKNNNLLENHIHTEVSNNFQFILNRSISLHRLYVVRYAFEMVLWPVKAFVMAKHRLWFKMKSKERKRKYSEKSKTNATRTTEH